MSPVVNAHGDQSSSNQSSRSDRQQERRTTDLLWRVNFTNTLRDIPFDGKCIAYPFEAGRFAEYRPTSMDLTRKFDLLTEPDLGVKIDLVTAAAGGYVAGPNVQLAPEDERLLEDEPTSGGPGEKGGLAAKKRRVPWLRRTQYLGADLQRYGTQTTLGETKVGRRLLAGIDPDELHKDPESQAIAIQQTFEMAQEPIPARHHSRPGVTPVEVLPVFPDFDMWQYPAAQVVFDSDPAPATATASSKAAAEEGVDRLSQAMIRGLQDDQGEQFVAYFLPTESTLKKRKRDLEEGVEFNPEDEYDYEVVREYNWNVRAPPDRQSGSRADIGFALIFHGDKVVYDELDTRVRLSKRKKPTAANVRSRLIVKFRPFTEGEIATQKGRLTVLDPSAALEEGAGTPQQDVQGDFGDDDAGEAQSAKSSSSDDD